MCTIFRIKYEFWNVNSVRCCLNIVADEWEADYWKSEVITFAVTFLILVVITNWLAVTKYTYLKWEWIYYIYIFSFLYHRQRIYRTWQWITRRMSYQIQELLTFREQMCVIIITCWLYPHCVSDILFTLGYTFLKLKIEMRQNWLHLMITIGKNKIPMLIYYIYYILLSLGRYLFRWAISRRWYASALTLFIRYIYYRNLQFRKNVII
jgi:hypothetical protein